MWDVSVYRARECNICLLPRFPYNLECNIRYACTSHISNMWPNSLLVKWVYKNEEQARKKQHTFLVSMRTIVNTKFELLYLATKIT